MNTSEQHTIYTIGHSTHTLAEFIDILQSIGIQTLVDIRRFPGSRKYPQYNKGNLEIELPANHINYIYLEGLGGRHKLQKDSRNTAWHNLSFRAYADYMESVEFEKAIATLESIALESQTVYMCSEAVWWRCHRALVSDYLKAKGWNVLHIMGEGKVQEHTYTSPAKVIGDRVYYNE